MRAHPWSGSVVVVAVVAVLAAGRGDVARSKSPLLLASASTFTITGDISDLTPGAPGSLVLTVHNHESVPITVDSLGVALGSPLPDNCDASDLDLSKAAYTGAFDVAASGTGSVTLPVTLLDSGANQESCAGATFPLVFSGSATVAEVFDTSTALVSSLNPSTVSQLMKFTATVTPTGAAPNPPTGSVTFKDGAATLATVPVDATGVAAMTTASLDSGEHTITADYTNTDGNFTASNSGPLTQRVNPVSSGGGGGGGTTTTTVGGNGTGRSIQPNRIAGPDRIDTAVAASQDQFADGKAGAVVLSRSDLYPDALAGTPLAVKEHAPMLLTPSSALDPRTENEARRVLPSGGTVYVLGGPDAINQNVVTALSADGYTVVRLGGPNRFATAVAIAQFIGTPQAILLGTADNPADALAGGAAAAKLGGVMVLTDDATMPPDTAAYLAANHGVVQWALGGPAAAADPTATALVGADRYATSVLVAQQFFPLPSAAGFANGFAFPDALSGGADIGAKGGPLVLVAPGMLPTTVHDYLVSVGATITTAEVYGGTDVIPEAELGQIGAALSGV